VSSRATSFEIVESFHFLFEWVMLWGLMVVLRDAFCRLVVTSSFINVFGDFWCFRGVAFLLALISVLGV
jgi:hypothetical protein